jgi:hypothetical protein
VSPAGETALRRAVTTLLPLVLAAGVLRVATVGPDGGATPDARAGTPSATAAPRRPGDPTPTLNVPGSATPTAPGAPSPAGFNGPVALPGAIAADTPPPPLAGPVFPVAPYASPRYLLDDPKGPNVSFYTQPWRAHVETRSARHLLDGIGMNYTLPHDADHDAVIRLLASAGVKHLRIDVGFASYDGKGIRDGDRQYVDAVLKACRRYGVRPMLLLSAHSGAPGPHTRSTRKLVAPAQAGSRVVVLDDVRGLKAGYSGLSDLTESWMAQVVITSVDAATGTVQLSRPLPKDLPAGDVEVDTLRYLPLYPVGTPQFEETMRGWSSYVTAVLDRVHAAKLSRYDVEIWNELSFAGWWLSINNYYSPAVAPDGKDFLRPGGTGWELADRTTRLVKSRDPRTRVVWGFSNTTFYHTAIPDLPRGVDAESYHPYGAGPAQYPDGLRTDPAVRWEHDYRPRLRKVMPEGWAHLGVTLEQLFRGKLSPQRRKEHPPGVARFGHGMTEHGLDPRSAGVHDRAEAAAMKAQFALRSLAFWLNKGMDFVDLFSAYDRADDGFGMLDSRTPATTVSPELAALRSFVSPMAGAREIAQPVQLSFGAVSSGPQSVVFPGDATHPGLPYREMLTLLPYQVSDSRFVVGSYVMSYDVTDPPPPMRFRVSIGRLPFRHARLSLLDPRTGAATPVAGYRDARGALVVDLTLADSLQWLVVDRA